MISRLRQYKLGAIARTVLAIGLAACLLMTSVTSHELSKGDSVADCCGHTSLVGAQQLDPTERKESLCLQCAWTSCGCQTITATNVPRGASIVLASAATAAQPSFFDLGPYCDPFLDQPAEPPKV